RPCHILCMFDRPHTLSLSSRSHSSLLLLISFPHPLPTSTIYTLSLHDALPISKSLPSFQVPSITPEVLRDDDGSLLEIPMSKLADRKSTRLNSSHGSISYAVFCLKKKRRGR